MSKMSTSRVQELLEERIGELEEENDLLRSKLEELGEKI